MNKRFFFSCSWPLLLWAAFFIHCAPQANNEEPPPAPQPWEWRPAADYGGQPVRGAVAFTIGDSAYVGTGGYSNGSGISNEFWVFNPAGNSWMRLADFPGLLVMEAVGFAINQQGYVVCGWNENSASAQVWEYDPAGNAWMRKAEFPAWRVSPGRWRWASASSHFYLSGRGPIKAWRIFAISGVSNPSHEPGNISRERKMIKKRFLSFVYVSLAVLLCCSCSSPAPEPDEPDAVPLDGRGGGVIAYCRGQGNGEPSEIWGINADGSGLTRLTAVENVQDSEPAWSPDGSLIAFCSSLSGAPADTEIFVMNADGSNRRQLTSAAGNDYAINPDWKPILH